MVLSKSFQLLFIAILAALGGLFVLFLFWDITLWVPAWVVAGMAFIVFLVALFWCNSVFGSGTERRPPNSVEYLVMIALIIVVFLTAITVASDPRWLWLLLPVWILPAMAIVLLLISSGLGFGLRREDGKIKFRSIKLKLELACGLGLLVLTILLFLLWINSTKDSSYPLSFDGNSNQLKQTVIVPTLDTPILERKSAIWCASFQIAWNKFKTELAKGPVEIAGAELVADRLNRGEQSEDDLEPGSFYSAAGLAKDWIMENIQADMAVNFPKARKVEFSKTGEEIAVAFGYLQANVTFDPPFLERDGPIVFRSQEKDFGNEVKFFGIPKKPGNQQLRDQVEVMYFADEEGDDEQYH